MLQKINLFQQTSCSQCSDTVIKFAKDLEFTVGDFKKDKLFHIKNVKGNLEITKITKRDDMNETEIVYDKVNKSFGNDDKSCFCFYITANIGVEENDEQICDVTYQLRIPSARLHSLKVNEYFQSDIVLPGYDNLKFTYFICKSEPCDFYAEDIEIYIVNPYEIEVQGRKRKSNVLINVPSIKDVDMPLLFRFDQNVYPPSFTQLQVTQASSADKGHQESDIPTELSSATKLLHKISSNKRFADVFFISSDETKIPSYRNILAVYSDIFARIFEESTELPVQINVEDFDADTIYCAISFLYDKPDAINGKELDVFHFAVKYGIQALIDACCSFFEKSVDPSNVCDFIQIAYFNNFEELKQKCLKVLVQKKDEIDPSKTANLPKNIVLDAFYFKL